MDTAAGAGERTVLEVSDLVVSFRGARRVGRADRRAVRAVDGISLRIDSAETLGLVGESGSGKSTTARAILQLVPAQSGSVAFEGADLRSAGRTGRRNLRRHAQMIFQNPLASLNARLKVGSIIREPLDIHGIGDGHARRRRVNELLELVGLPDDALDRFPHEFSGGQQQRIAIARALAPEPSLIICDEPVAALDVSIQAQILQLLKDLQRTTGVSYLFIAHDLNVVRHVSRRTAIMYVGKIVEEGPSVALFGAPRHPYTQALVSAIPVPDPSAEQGRTVLGGEIPSPANVPSGCRFRTRCRYARERCATEEPRLEEDCDGVSVACHFWREIAAGSHPPAGDAPASDVGFSV
jgi:oligopeptide/dipeptide ABC transporter ATP-binding protein